MNSPLSSQDGALVEVACRCGTRAYLFANRRNLAGWRGTCSGCSERSRLNGKLWHSSTGQVAPYHPLKSILAEPLDLLWVEWDQDAGYRRATLYFAFCESPLLPVGRTMTSSRPLLAGLERLGGRREVIAIVEDGRSYQLWWEDK